MPRPTQEISIAPQHGLPQETPAPATPSTSPETRTRANVPSPRQTLSFLRGLIENHGLEPKAKLGQNFLIDLNLMDLAVRAAQVDAMDSVLEVGTGTGSLSAKIADCAGCLFTVEVDRDFHRLAQHTLARRPNLVSYFGDALARKNELNPEMLAGWDELTRKHNLTRRKLVANLPYAIATPVISNLLLLDNFTLDRMVVMVQWEIAERLRATVGTKEYNALSVLVQSVADVEIVRKVAPTNFYPKPKVDSAIVMIVPNAQKRARVGDARRFRVFLRDLYCHRRKNLRQALKGWPSGRREMSNVDAMLAELKIDGNIRAEALGIEEHLRLCAAFSEEVYAEGENDS